MSDAKMTHHSVNPIERTQTDASLATQLVAHSASAVSRAVTRCKALGFDREPYRYATRLPRTYETQASLVVSPRLGTTTIPLQD